jgi:hypothetical protein
MEEEAEPKYRRVDQEDQAVLAVLVALVDLRTRQDMATEAETEAEEDRAEGEAQGEAMTPDVRILAGCPASCRHGSRPQRSWCLTIPNEASRGIPRR